MNQTLATNAPAATGLGSWEDARQAMLLLAVVPCQLGGIRLRSWHSAARDRWLKELQQLCGPEFPRVDLPAQTPPDRLLGGLDLTATLQTGKRHVSRGLLAHAHGGLLVVRAGERLDNTQLAALNEALDDGRVRLERDGLSHIWPARFGCIALDEGVPFEESIATSLADRLAFDIDLHAVALADLDRRVVDLNQERARVVAARQLLPHVKTPDSLLPALCQAAWNLNVRSLRAPALALRVARAAAALNNSETVLQEHAELAVRLVFGPRAIASQSTPEQQPHEPEQQEAANDGDQDAQQETEQEDEQEEEERAGPEPQTQSDRPDDNPEDEIDKDASIEELAEQLVAVAQAALPAQLLGRAVFAKLRGSDQPGAGRFGPSRPSFSRGVPIPSRPGKLGGHARLDLLATLRRAMPWQRLRGRAATQNAPPKIQAEDFAIKRFKQHAPTVTLFVVDASGSAAMQRLAEAKGAVEELLAECYVRRDEVGLIAFRGTGAEMLLSPTRSLVRAKRVLGKLLGGGGTPLASGLALALQQTQLLHRRGAIPLVVLLTDGSANVSLAGVGDRAQAREETKTLAGAFGAAGEAMIVVDTSVRGHKLAREIADLAEAVYLPLPYAQQDALLDQVRVVTRARQTR